MKKYMFALAMVLAASSLTGCNPCNEDPLTKLGDTLATLGKKGMEKDQVLAERKAGRAAKCAEQKAAEMKKKMGF